MALKEARLKSQLGDQVSAARLYQESIKEGKGKGLSDEDLSRAYLELARTQLALSSKEQASKSFDMALEFGIRCWGKDGEQLIPIYEESAANYYSQHSFETANALAREALRLEKGCCGVDRKKLIEVLNLIIASQCAQDRCADTEPYLIEQLAIRRELLGNNHPHIAVSLCLLGELKEKKGQYKEAEAYFQKAVELRKSSEPGLVALTEKNVQRVRAKLNNH